MGIGEGDGIGDGGLIASPNLRILSDREGCCGGGGDGWV